jgi:hypothetical protein
VAAERKALEIVCEGCGAETFARREPVYEGFARKGERFVCVSCGRQYADEKALPLRTRKAPAVFGPEDAPSRVDIFSGEEAPRNCRRCAHYTVNPFTQRCGLHRRVVQATECCPDFAAEEAAEGRAGGRGAPPGGVKE